MLRYWFKAAVLVWLVPGCLGAAARLYTEEDPVVILSSSSLKPTVSNSSSAWLVQFYSSWCGHCIQYSSTWKTLAQDVKGTAENAPVLLSSTFRSVSFVPVSPDSIQHAYIYLFPGKPVKFRKVLMYNPVCFLIAHQTALVRH